MPRKVNGGTEQRGYRVPELKAIEHLDISLLCLLLFYVQLLPKGIDASHVQHLVCVYFPGVAAKQMSFGQANSMEVCGIFVKITLTTH